MVLKRQKEFTGLAIARELAGQKTSILGFFPILSRSGVLRDGSGGAGSYRPEAGILFHPPSAMGKKV